MGEKTAGRSLRTAAGIMLAMALAACAAADVPASEEKTPAAAQEDAGNTARGETVLPAESADAQTAEETDRAAQEEAEPTSETAPKTTAETEATMETGQKKTAEFSIPAKEIPENAALAFTASLGAGINWGNTFDAYMDEGLADDLSDELTTETCWHHTETTKEAIRGIADAGFSTIRLPVSWHNHIADDEYTISPVWMDRVNTVVDWALDAGLNVILNIHHDNHPAANGFYPDTAHRAQSERYISRIWQQLAERYKDYDERLIFESMNEPRLVGHESEWWFDVKNPPDDVRDAIGNINALNQIFVDTVRSVDGAHRACYLMCPGYDASPDGALTEDFRLPADAEGIENRIIVSVHAYTPYAFALEEDGTASFDPSKNEDVREIDDFMDKLYRKYIQAGTPVVIGEFGARDRRGNLADRAAFTAYYTARARSCGLPCFWWDNGAFSGSGEIFGIYDRTSGEWKYPEIRDAMLTNAIR